MLTNRTKGKQTSTLARYRQGWNALARLNPACLAKYGLPTHLPTSLTEMAPMTGAVALELLDDTFQRCVVHTPEGDVLSEAHTTFDKIARVLAHI